ncbi:MAG: phage holin family protein [Myxococcota bacterium]|nr:phage holin family protein [Myxococcota bacterium]
MLGFVVRLLIAALGLWLAAQLVPGVSFDGWGTLVGAALLLGLVNAVVRPIAILLTLPVTILTLGLFLWVVNAAMLGLVAALLSGFHLAGFGSALLAAAVVSLTAWVGSWWVGPRGRVEVMVVREGTRTRIP